MGRLHLELSLFLAVARAAGNSRVLCSVGSRSHDHASWPLSRNASRTIPENSQATRTLRTFLAGIAVSRPLNRACGSGFALSCALVVLMLHRLSRHRSVDFSASGVPRGRWSPA